MSALVLFGGAKKVPFVPIGQGVWGGWGSEGDHEHTLLLGFWAGSTLSQAGVSNQCYLLRILYVPGTPGMFF